MISRIRIRHFQSLHDVDVELGSFTVIIGPSNSGKSAFMRALRTLVSNARGTSFIEQGETVMAIMAYTDRGIVALKRGRSAKDNEYVVTPDPSTGETPRRYTKLEGTTPPEVSTFLGIDPKDSIFYASQLDKPYLLDDTGNEVARTLGALTNVNVVFEGSREARRRSLEAGRTLKTRQGDLTAAEARIPEFVKLRDQRAAQDRAEELLEQAQQATERLLRVTTLIETQTAAEEHLASLPPAQQALPSLSPLRSVVERQTRFLTLQSAIRAAQADYDKTDFLNVSPLPDTTELRAAVARQERFAILVESSGTAKANATEWRAKAESATEALTAAQAEYIAALIAAGTCPTCHQSTTHLEHA